MITTRGRQVRQEQYKQEETGAGKKTRRRAENRKIKEKEFMPMTIKGYSDGIPTSTGKKMSSYVLEHLESGETITASVFENQAPNYIDEKILDAVLPEDLEEFDANDLEGRGFNVKVKFNEKNGKTFTNIVDAEPLDDEQQELLDQMLEELALKKQRNSEKIRESVEMLSEMHNHDSFSSRNMKEVSMEEMEAPDPYTQGVVLKGSVEEESEYMRPNTWPDRSRKYPHASRTSEVTEEDAEILDFDEDDDNTDLNLDDDFEVYLCDECQDKGCEACDDY